MMPLDNNYSGRDTPARVRVLRYDSDSDRGGLDTVGFVRVPTSSVYHVCFTGGYIRSTISQVRQVLSKVGVQIAWLQLSF